MRKEEKKQRVHSSPLAIHFSETLNASMSQKLVFPAACESAEVLQTLVKLIHGHRIPLQAVLNEILDVFLENWE